MKRSQGTTISLCIPTLNEEKTIGTIVETLKSALMDHHVLLDEIVVIDSGSTDNTKQVAITAGAQFYLAEDVRPDLGNHQGKGENLWKALHQLKGDIICYIDGDIANIHPRFVYGLVAPLLHDPEVQYTKACYERPLTHSNITTPNGGGRVTEILIRPLFSLFYPELTAFMQPLSGEYAARRDLLTSIPFPSGYGVESCHLIDIYEQHGLSAFAQTDLDQRVHRNQSTQALGRMSFNILQCIAKRLQNKGLISSKISISEIYRHFTIGDYEPIEYHSTLHERPPVDSCS